MELNTIKGKIKISIAMNIMICLMVLPKWGYSQKQIQLVTTAPTQLRVDLLRYPERVCATCKGLF